MIFQSRRILLACAYATCGLSLLCVPPAAAQPVTPPETQPNNNQNNTNNQTPSVLNATNAREIARVSCTDADGATCFSPAVKSAISAIDRNFNGTLLGPSGKDDSELSKAIVVFLGQSNLWPPSEWAIVHLVDYDSSNQAHDKWLRARRKGGVITVNDFTHIPGAKEIGLVFLQMNRNFKIKMDLSDPLKPLPDQSQAALASFSSVSYRAIVAKKLPYPVQNLLGILKLFPNLQGDATTKTVNIAGGGIIQQVDVPSDVTAFAVQLGNPAQLIGQSQKYDNEGKYFWDVSVGVPVNKLSVVDYDSTNNVFAPKTINKQSVYALLNLYPDLVDLKYGNKRFYLPRAVAGIGLTGRPGENFMFGGAWGIKELQFFAGSAFANQNIATAGSMPSAGAVTKQRYTSHLVYGLNIPVVSAIKQLASKSSSSK